MIVPKLFVTPQSLINPYSIEHTRSPRNVLCILVWLERVHKNGVHNMHLLIHPKPNQKIQISNSKLDKTKRSTKGAITKV